MILSRTARWLLGLAVMIGLGFIYIPLGVVIINSFNASQVFSWPPSEWTLRWWSAALQNDGVRAALAVNPEEVQLSRQHNDANVLALSAKFTDAATADQYVKLFLETAFEGGRHQRRVDKISQIEQR